MNKSTLQTMGRFMFGTVLLSLFIYAFVAESSVMISKNDLKVNSVEAKGSLGGFSVRGLIVDGSNLFVNYYIGSQVFDLSDPSRPKSEFAIQENYKILGMRGDNLFVIARGGLFTVDSTSSSSPTFSPNLLEDVVDIQIDTLDQENRLFGDVLILNTLGEVRESLFFDIRNPASVELIWRDEITVEKSFAYNQDDNIIYIADTNNDLQSIVVEAVDVSDFSNVQPISLIQIDASQDTIGANAISFANNTVFVGTHNAGVKVIDAADSNDLQLLTTIATNDPNAVDVASEGDWLAFRDNSDHEVYLYDMSHPRAPVLKDKIATTRFNVSGRVAIEMGKLYIGQANGIDIYDIAFPLQDNLIAKIDTAFDNTPDMVSADNFVYIAQDSSVKIIDVSDKYRPMQVTQFSTVAETRRMVLSNEQLAVLSNGALELFDVSDHTTPLRTGLTTNVSNGATAIAFINEYIAVSNSADVQLFEISDVGELSQAGTLPHGGYDLVGSSDTMFLLDRTAIHAISIVDIAQPSIIDSITFEQLDVLPNQPSISIENGQVYVAYCEIIPNPKSFGVFQDYGGIKVFSFVDNAFTLIRDHTFNLCLKDIEVVNNIAFTSSNIFDVSNPSRILRLAAFDQEFKPPFDDDDVGKLLSIATVDDDDHYYRISYNQFQVYGYQFEGLYEVWLPIAR